MIALEALEARLAAAVGPDRELDVAILTTCLGYRDIDGNLFDRGNDGYWTLEGDEKNPPLPSPTGSIDAALTLKPDGWKLQLFEHADGTWFVRLRRITPYDLVAQDDMDPKPPTAPLAICLAAIRARIAAEPLPAIRPDPQSTPAAPSQDNTDEVK